MKLQKSTISLLITAILLGGVVYFAESKRKPNLEKPQQQTQKLFDFQEENIQRIVIKNPSETLEFERNNDEKQPWKMTQPEKAIANEAVVVFLLNSLVEAESDRTFTIPTSQQKDYGFDPPFSRITITLQNQETHTLVLGNPDFQDQLLYAQVEPPQNPESELTIVLVPQNFQYAVNRELSEWKQPPEATEDLPISPEKK